MSARQIRFGGAEHQQRETHAVHAHHSSDTISYYGNGRTVLVVVKDRRKGRAFCEVIGEDGATAEGEDFCYASYFLPEEMGLCAS